MSYPQQQQQQQVPSANDALGLGTSAPGIKFERPGDGVQGARILSFESRQERAYTDPRPDGTQVPYNERRLLFFPKTGDPIYGVVVTVQTSLRASAEDDGVRALFVEGKGKKAALRDAIKAAGASGLEVGALIDFAFTHSENPADPKARKHYAARYTPAAQAGANAALGNLGAPAQQPQYAAAPPAPANPWAPGAAPQVAPVQQATGIPPWVTQGA